MSWELIGMAFTLGYGACALLSFFIWRRWEESLYELVDAMEAYIELLEAKEDV